ncbi:MAG: HEPN domain-containing protein [Candidatus Altiarchaeota archaeon]|nr:HEPN domain-containing protein [Candidatus Altiarchaeota archaeon]
MNEIKTLVERAEKTLSSAELLFEEGDYEGCVSRAYYSMFYAAEALLLTKELKFSSHKGVISLFGEHFVKTGIFKADMGKNFQKTFQRRLIGDYSYSAKITRKEAADIIEWATGFLTKLKEYLEKQGQLK